MSAEAGPIPLSCEHLCVRYGRARVLEDVSFVVPAGGVYALLGRNGAGKSSLVRCLVGQQRPSAGRGHLFGRDAWSDRAALMARVGLVPEEPDAPAELSPSRLLELVAACTSVGTATAPAPVSAGSPSPWTRPSDVFPRGRRARSWSPWPWDTPPSC